MRFIFIIFSALGTMTSGCAVEAPASSPSVEIRRGVAMEGSPEERGRHAMERVVAEIEPSLHGDPARIGVYISFFKHEFVRDPRMFAFDAVGKISVDGTVVLTGYAEYQEHRDTLNQFLNLLGFHEIDNQIELLPAKLLGDRPFAVVKSARATLYDRLAKPRENVSQALIGDPLFLLMEVDGYYLCHAGDGYVGYIAASDVQRVTAGELSASQALPRGTLMATLTIGGVTLPAGTHLPVAGREADTVKLKLPDGSIAAVPNGSMTVIDESAAQARVSPVLAVAHEFMGTKYVWGGKSLDGIDCSGLVQTSFQTQDVRLPRDADQQAYVGQLVATRGYREGLRVGDTLYFMSRTGRIAHTALYLGDHQYIEAASPGVKVTSFDPTAKNYDARRDRSFCFAKRILD